MSGTDEKEVSCQTLITYESLFKRIDLKNRLSREKWGFEKKGC
jgi:hypothetical protein